MSQFGGIPYFEMLIIARRWQECVNFGSPMSAWTMEMHKQYQAQQTKEQHREKPIPQRAS